MLISSFYCNWAQASSAAFSIAVVGYSEVKALGAIYSRQNVDDGSILYTASQKNQATTVEHFAIFSANVDLFSQILSRQTPQEIKYNDPCVWRNSILP